MRKIDYQLLAHELRRARESAQRAEKMTSSDVARSNHFHGKYSALRDFALWCSDNLAVDRGAFLKACGID